MIGPYLLIQGVWLAFVLTSFFLLKRVDVNKILIFALILISLVYTESLNGLETFNSYQAFKEIRSNVQPYFGIFPFKVYQSVNIEDEPHAYVFSLEGKQDFGFGVSLKDVFITPIKIKEGKVYYYKYRITKFGSLPEARWFEFGKEEFWGGA